MILKYTVILKVQSTPKAQQQATVLLVAARPLSIL
jgi:hypothetical protein